jgi:hypothetical protein
MASMLKALGRLQWGWLVWNVLVPTVGPPLLTLLILSLWMTGDLQTKLDLKEVLADLTPWALCFYALTLIGSSLYELGGRVGSHLELGGSMVLVGFLVLIYAVLTVLWRVMGKDANHLSVYVVTGVLWLAAVALCHWSYVVRIKPLPAAPAVPERPAAAVPGVRA